MPTQSCQELPLFLMKLGVLGPECSWEGRSPKGPSSNGSAPVNLSLLRPRAQGCRRE